jgi:predicted Rossmann fold flavoprotein
MAASDNAQGGGSGPIVVVGAGAAGLMAAIHAATGPRRVLLLERTKDGGRKILISGGGRCNVLPSQLSPHQYITASSANTMRRMLLSWPLDEQRAFFERRLGLRLELEPETGKLFPATHRARDVRDGLVAAARNAGVELRFNMQVDDVKPGAGDARWSVITADGSALGAHTVILAAGGLSVPATGSDGIGLRIARTLGHEINETYPALTPLTAQPPVHAHLAGISLNVRLTAPLARASFETAGGFLFTHRGYSGPAALDISHVAVLARLAGRPQPIRVQWTARDAAAWQQALIAGGSGAVGGIVRRELPQRLSDVLLAESGVEPERQLSQLRRDERARLVEVLTRYELPWTGDEGYRKAEVTGGGVALGEVDARTLESRRARGLFVCGEMLDAFGPIGGYNFAWAWATGRAAGLAAAAQP